jgi:hypothetical protein
MQEWEIRKISRTNLSAGGSVGAGTMGCMGRRWTIVVGGKGWGGTIGGPAAGRAQWIGSVRSPVAAPVLAAPRDR